ncbi:putative ribonuclease H-like domain-containing protein [Tanacetum coccineum]
MDKCKTGLGYNVVPPPYTRNFMPPKSNLVYHSLDDFVDVNESVSESVVKKPTVETNEPETARKENKAPIIEDWVSDSDEENVPKVKTVEMFNKPSFSKIKFVKSTKQVKSPRKISVDINRQNTPSPRGNKRNWNQQIMIAITGIIMEDLQNQFGPMFKRSGLISLNTARPVNTVQPRTVVNNAGPMKNVNTVKGNKGNAVKASACWVWRPKHKILDHVSRNNNYEEINGGFIAFGGNSKGGKITGKGKIRTGKLDFEDVYFVKELKFNLFSVSQMCDKKNSVLFTDTECVVLSPDFKLTDERGLTCLFAKATPDESNLWHRRLGHVNFKTMNKLKGKKHRASSKTKTVSSISQPLQILHMDLFGPTFVKSLMKKMYCLVVTDDFSRHRKSNRVKVIRYDNRTEFKNRVINQFCEMKGIKREFSVARTPQQNGVAERKNKTLIEAARTMLADLKLPTTFWLKQKSALSFMRPFGCPVTILNTIDHLGSGPNWLFDIDALTKSINYKPVVAENQSNGSAGTKACDDAGKARTETISGKDYILLPMWPADPLFSQNSKSFDVRFKPSGEDKKKVTEEPGKECVNSSNDQEKDDNINSSNNINIASDGNNTNNVNAVNSTVNAAVTEVNVVDPKISIELLNDPDMPQLEDIVYSDDDEDVGA